MAVELSWHASTLVTGLHIANAIARGQSIVDPNLATAVQQPAEQLANEIRAAALPAELFWRHLIPLAANLPQHRQLVEAAVAKTIGRGPRFEIIVANIDSRIA